MSPEVLTFLRELLRSQSLSVGAPDFAATVPIVLRALAELNATIEEGNH